MPFAQVAEDHKPLPEADEAGRFSYAECGGVRVWRGGGVVRIQAGDARGAPVELSTDEIEALIAALKP